MDKKQQACDVRSNRHGEIVHMYNVLAGKSSTLPQLSHDGHM